MDWRNFVVEAESNQLFRRKFTTYSDVRQVAFFIGEVENGGIIQYLDNSSGDEFKLLKRAATIISCEVLVATLRKLESFFPNGKVPSDRGVRGDIIDELIDAADGEDPFEGLNSWYNANFECVVKCLNMYVDKLMGKQN